MTEKKLALCLSTRSNLWHSNSSDLWVCKG